MFAEFSLSQEDGSRDVKDNSVVNEMRPAKLVPTPELGNVWFI